MAAEVGPIPADAGEPKSNTPQTPALWAYPRGRGGTSLMCVTGLANGGLSPRTRGNLLRGGPIHHGGGPIPADAGEPTACPSSPGPPRAYPRGRGGTASILSELKRREGLSPRTRGSPELGQCHSLSLGPIPADAGEPSGAGRPPPPSRAYPRGRGGAVQRLCGRRDGEGLSPRTRGSRSKFRH